MFVQSFNCEFTPHPELDLWPHMRAHRPVIPGLEKKSQRFRLEKPTLSETIATFLREQNGAKNNGS